MNTTQNELLSFIHSSPTAFHAVSSLCSMFKENGYTELKENEEWKIEPNGKYYITRNQSSFIAFKIPESKKCPSFMITAAHSDSPTFKVKHNFESVSGSYKKLNTERYGGMLCSTWFDRPLSVAGRVTTSKDGVITSTLVNMVDPLYIIPSVAIHMNRNANENASYNAAVDLQPIGASAKSDVTLKSIIAKKLNINEEDIVSSDLYIYPTERGCVFGTDSEFICSPRIDDLQCVFAGAKALIDSKNSEAVSMLYIADNEEVGSSTKQGADSTFLNDTITSILSKSENNSSSLRQVLSASFMVSADNAHAVHPNHPELSDPSHRPIINEGIVIKHNASQLYTTDAISYAIFDTICKKANVPTQVFANRSDMRGGSTLGNISSTQVSINTVDIGLPQLAMHSCFETAGVMDTDYLISALKVLYSSSLKMTNDGTYELIGE